MTRQLDLIPRPAAPVPAPLVAVDRAIAELRRGGPVVVRHRAGAVLVLAAEAVTDEALADLAARTGRAPALAVTGRRAAVLGLRAADGLPAVVLLRAGSGRLTAADVAWLADPCERTAARRDRAGFGVEDIPAGSAIAAAVGLAKAARLLPAAIVADASSAGGGDLPTVSAEDVAGYQQNAARTLRVVSEARVPLKDAENARIVAFRPSDGGVEHLAIVIGEPDADRPVLARLHSECFTGDLLGSLRCDCGDQLRGAIAEIAQAGSGVLLYLAQEGRGIGLVNKLRAYQLQDDGFDTLDANLQLGFDDDERIYQPAAQMLRLLGVRQVRLMTNNPGKMEALARHGIDVMERVPHVFPANDHNRFYLSTKAARGGHLF
ncbi:MAG: GTP cyclohydrolase II [Magnetospirillum sp.]|nr:GTP cyclohydrolase II [Magnetospirillum sp.]